MIDLHTERKIITKYNCESFIGHTVYMEKQLKEQIKKLKEQIMEKPGKWEYPNTIESVPNMIDDIFGNALCVNSEQSEEGQ